MASTPDRMTHAVSQHLSDKPSGCSIRIQAKEVSTSMHFKDAFGADRDLKVHGPAKEEAAATAV
ncbi:hypothetical protein [Jiella mangrovi]|uniref:Uncharacterized protein n=1 Tax=Jiella mangrovi TaxID=2821407 RepID=A0ABS4BNH8_9HYPH|nr:hypothetical protein [Jiella mangrovi]MBP0617704.1 hypothetical protein [Jiella mangrovi]